MLVHRPGRIAKPSTVGFLLALMVGGAVSDLRGTVHTDHAPAPSAASATVRWNGVARALVRRGYVDPLWAVRAFALASVAQHDAAWAVASSAGSHDAEPAIVAAAMAVSAATVLAELYPHEVPRIAADLYTDLEPLHARASGPALASAIATAEAVARRLIAERATDRAVSLEGAIRPSGNALWISLEGRPPLRPDWGRVRPMLLTDAAALVPRPPPALDSAEVTAALEIVRAYTRVGSARQDALVRKWADGPGTDTPPGHWNAIAVELIRTYGVDDVDAARVLAVMNMALLDASIACWRTKFEYWYPRPPQVDPRVVPTLPPPNFPSYPSGHASFSGAASAVLAYRFPADAPRLVAMAEEAAESRVVAGIHYSFDSAEGLRQGRHIADLAIARYKAGGPLRSEGRRTAPETREGEK